MSPRRGARALAAVAALTLALGACGGDGDGEAEASVAPGDLDADFLPSQLLDLTVEKETVESVEAARGTYLDGLGLYSVREGDLLQATLQVGRFSEEAEYTDDTFQRAIVNQLGASAPTADRRGDQRVWLTTGKSQRVSVWFEQDMFFVLAVRDDFEQGRTLLRETLELDK